MNLASDFVPNERVVYVPLHAHGDLRHADCEQGAVSSINDQTVFVKFDQHVKKFGWDGATAQGCDPCDLVSADKRVRNSQIK